MAFVPDKKHANQCLGGSYVYVLLRCHTVKSMWFGRVTITEGADFGRYYRYSTKYWDTETDLYHYTFRDYDAESGRQTSRDPLSEEHFFLTYTSGKPKEAIARLRKKALQPSYLFVNNNPINDFDLLGLLQEVLLDSELGDVYGGDFYWYDQLPDCPCHIEMVNNPCCPEGNKKCCAKENNGLGGGWTTTGKANQSAHEGAVWEIRWYAGATNSGQQCTYDSKGDLITEGKAAGTPDIFGFAGNFCDMPLHGTADLLPYVYYEAINSLDIYLQIHPPNKGKNCRSNAGGDSAKDISKIHQTCD